MDYTIIKIKTNFTDLHGWIAVGTSNQPVGHVFMQIEKNSKVKLFDDWVDEEQRGKGIYTDLWDTRWKYIQEEYSGYTAYAWCLPTSLNTYRKKGFNEGEPAIYMEREVN